MTRRRLVLAAFAAAAGGWILFRYGRRFWVPVYLRLAGRLRSVDDVVAAFGPAAEARLRPHFAGAGAAYPPPRFALVAFKEEMVLELWAEGAGPPRFVRRYPVRNASGGPGPKLREGDRQVPEGLYRIDGLNPNSAFHLSLKLDYPNASDLAHARADGRANPGSNIFIHGTGGSVGCLDMGNEAIEELFVLAARAGIGNIRVVIAPHDPRGGRPLVPPPDAPPWTADLYARLGAELAAFGGAASRTVPGR